MLNPRAVPSLSPLLSLALVGFLNPVAASPRSRTPYQPQVEHIPDVYIDLDDPEEFLRHRKSNITITDAADLDLLNSKRSPPPPATFESLGAELLMLKENLDFFKHLQSPLLMDILCKVDNAKQMREAIEHVKLWRYSGGQMDWPVAEILAGTFSLRPSPGYLPEETL